MITIKKVLAEQEGGCNACFTIALRKHTKYVFNIQIKNNPTQSTSIRLCKLHLNELACACADALDPMPTPKKKKAVGWQKVMDDLAKRPKV